MLLEIFQEVSRSWLVHLCSLPGAETGQGNLDGMVLLASFQERKEVLGKFGHLLRESGLVAGTNSIGQYGDCSSAWQPGALALLHFLCFFQRPQVHQRRGTQPVTQKIQLVSCPELQSTEAWNPHPIQGVAPSNLEHLNKLAFS